MSGVRMKQSLHPAARGSPLLETKRAPPSLGAVSADGTFEGYASLFNLPDLGRDIVMPGAFARSLATRGTSGIKLLWQHQAAQPIGSWLEIREDARGLFVRGKLNLEVARARELLALLREGAATAFPSAIAPRRREPIANPACGNCCRWTCGKFPS